MGFSVLADDTAFANVSPPGGPQLLLAHIDVLIIAHIIAYVSVVSWMVYLGDSC